MKQVQVSSEPTFNDSGFAIITSNDSLNAGEVVTLVVDEDVLYDVIVRYRMANVDYIVSKI